MICLCKLFFFLLKLKSQFSKFDRETKKKIHMNINPFLAALKILISEITLVNCISVKHERYI